MGCTCSHPRLSQPEPLRGPNSQLTSGTMPLLTVFSVMLLPTEERFSPMHLMRLLTRRPERARTQHIGFVGTRPWHGWLRLSFSSCWYFPPAFAKPPLS